MVFVILQKFGQDTKIDFNKQNDVDDFDDGYDSGYTKKSFASKIYSDVGDKLEKDNETLAESHYQIKNNMKKEKSPVKNEVQNDDIDFLS